MDPGISLKQNGPNAPNDLIEQLRAPAATEGVASKQQPTSGAAFVAFVAPQGALRGWGGAGRRWGRWVGSEEGWRIYVWNVVVLWGNFIRFVDSKTVL